MKLRLEALDGEGQDYFLWQLISVFNDPNHEEVSMEEVFTLSLASMKGWPIRSLDFQTEKTSVGTTNRVFVRFGTGFMRCFDAQHQLQNASVRKRKLVAHGWNIAVSENGSIDVRKPHCTQGRKINQINSLFVECTSHRSSRRRRKATRGDIASDILMGRIGVAIVLSTSTPHFHSCESVVCVNAFNFHY